MKELPFSSILDFLCDFAPLNIELSTISCGKLLYLVLLLGMGHQGTDSNTCTGYKSSQEGSDMFFTS
jgi:hypothetical protein